MTKEITNDLLILPLQFFAEAGADGTEGAAGAAGAEGAEAGAEGTDGKDDASKTALTITQAELDSRISKAVAANKAKQEKEYQRLLDKAQQDGIIKGKSYADLTDEQRKEQDLADRLAKIQAQEEALNARERRAAILADLSEQKLPADFADLIIHEKDEAKAKATVTKLKKVFDDAVNEQAKVLVRQTDPKGPGAGAGSAKTPAQRIAEARNNQTNAPGFDPWAKK
jgi:hypothetical protein